MSTLNEIKDFFHKLGQEGLNAYLDELDSAERESVLEQLTRIDLSFISNTVESEAVSIDAPPSCKRVEEIQEYLDTGNKLISDGKAAALIVAGGQGTRLKFDGPKGMFPISPGDGKTLFELLAERVLKTSKACGRALQIVLMTSPENDEITRNFFKSHRNFGLDESQIHFYSQGELPLVTPEGELFFSSRGKLAMGPDGNGSSLSLLWSSGVGAQLEKQGVEQLTYNLIDNPLSNPFDPLLIAWNAVQNSDVTIKCIKREEPEEKVGVIVRANGKIAVKEYSEIDLKIRSALDVFPYANISLFCFALKFTKTINFADLPLHKAFKSSPRYAPGGKQIEAGAPGYWKYERFIFDVLLKANKVELLLYPRESCFAPLKDRASIPAVQAALFPRP